MFALKALSRLGPSVYTTASVYEYGGFSGLANCLQANVSSEELATVAVRVAAVLSFVPDCKAVATDGAIIDAVLYAMLEHSGNAMISESGRDVLNNIATEADAERHVNDLDRSLTNAATDSESALKALAAAAGLSRIQRLMRTFENANAASIILKHLEKIIENPGSLATVPVSIGGQKLTLQEKLARAAMTTVETLAMGTTGSLDNIIPDALQASGGDKVNFSYWSAIPMSTSFCTNLYTLTVFDIFRRKISPREDLIRWIYCTNRLQPWQQWKKLKQEKL